MQMSQLPDLHRKHLLLALNTWFEGTGMTQIELGEAVGAGNSLVSKALRGEAGGHATLVRLCNFAGLDMQRKDPHWSPILGPVFDDLWDGSEEGARDIAALLLAASRIGKP
jgi:predicted XRE-type DNA-binding protein